MHSNAKIQWVSCYVGIHGNERANMLEDDGANCDKTNVNHIELSDRMLDETNRWYREYSKEKGRFLQCANGALGQNVTP